MSEMFPTSEELWFDNGKVSERSYIIALISSKICFDNKAGSCEHIACYNYADLVEVLRKEKSNG